VAGTCEYGEGLSGSINAGNFFTSLLVSFSRRTLLHGVSKKVRYICYGSEGRIEVKKTNPAHVRYQRLSTTVLFLVYANAFPPNRPGRPLD